jgi:GNAT superfamily N-acetyltransferase
MALQDEPVRSTRPLPVNADVTVSVRKAVRTDAGELAKLSQELLAFYGLPVRYQRSYMTHVIAERAFPANPEHAPATEILMAFTGDTAIGFLAYSESFAIANCLSTIFIQDLFVIRKARRLGVGRKLMVELARICAAREVGQLDWTTDPWNSKAKTFYEELGPLLSSDKVYYRMQAAQISEIARWGDPDETPA